LIELFKAESILLLCQGCYLQRMNDIREDDVGLGGLYIVTEYCMVLHEPTKCIIPQYVVRDHICQPENIRYPYVIRKSHEFRISLVETLVEGFSIADLETSGKHIPANSMVNMLRSISTAGT